MTVDKRLTWVSHALLPKDVLLKFYFSVILSSIMYDLVLWGACCNSDIISSIERLHCRAAWIILNLPNNMAPRRVLNFANWITTGLCFKVEIFNLFDKANNNILPDCLYKNMFRKRESSYSLRGQNVASIPRYNGRLWRDS